MRRDLRLQRCRHCGRAGNLHGHGWRMGCGEGVAGRVCRGIRVYCSQRHRRSGCGRTFTVWLSGQVPGHTVSAACLWRFLLALMQSPSALAAWQKARTGFSLESAYRWLRRMRGNQTHVRTLLLRVGPAPPGAHTKEPLVELLKHLEGALGTQNPVARFQIRFQEPWPMRF